MNLRFSKSFGLLAAVALSIPAANAAEKLTGTAFGTDPSANDKQAENILDGNLDTYFQTTKGQFGYCGIDLGESHIITRIGFACRNDATAQSRTVLGMFEGANKPDFSDAIPLQMIKEHVTRGEINYFDVNCSLGVRYVRFVGPEGSQTPVAELEVYGTKGEGDTSHLWQITNLPTVVINTANFQAPYDKEHEIASSVIIISEDGTNYFNKTAGVRERGNASRQFPKKPWRLKFDKKTAVLDAPAQGKKWTLINNYGDKTLMRNILAFEVAKKMDMEYVPFCRPVDVVMNGEYKGCYQLCDQIDIRENRLDITEMDEKDIEGDALTGGYFLEVDGYANEEPVWFQTNRYYLPITIKSPDDDVIQPVQKQYITDYINRMEQSLPSGDYGKDGYVAEPLGFPYRDIFDTPSFIRHMLVNEVAGNTDCYWSTILYKERNDPKVYTGPVWDFDLGFDNDNRTYHVWTKSGNGFLWDSGFASSAGNMRYFAQRVFLKDPATTGEIHDIWAQARENGLSAEWLNELVATTAAELDQSQKLNFMRWPILDQWVHMNPQVAKSYEGELKVLNRYIDAQMAHLDEVIGYVAPEPVEPDPVEPDPVEPDPDEPNDGIESVNLNSVRAYAVEGGVAFRQFVPGTLYTIYTADGRCMTAGECSNRVVTLPTGLYMVCIQGGKTSKIMVR